MGEKEDKEKAEKLAAAKRRVAQLQKKKKAAGEKGSISKKSIDATKLGEKEDTDVAAAAVEVDPTIEVKGANAAEEPVEESKEAEAVEDDDTDAAAFNHAIKSGSQASKDEDEEKAAISSPPTTASPSGESSSVKSRRPARQPSVSLQSKMRSASFRQGDTSTSPGAEGDDIPDIYRKQLARIEELEAENKRLAQEAQQSQARWRKNEDELEELRERAVDEPRAENSGEVQKLRSEIDSLRRNSRHSISVPKQKTDEDVENLRRALESKEATVNDMQLEISRLRSQASALTESGKNENEQIAALQDALQRAETSNMKVQSELQDVKKALSRATEKAVLDGTERTSKDTKIKALERDLDDSKRGREELDKRAETLEKKIETMNKLHREAEQRNAPKLGQADATVKELQLVRAKLEITEKDNLRLREARKHRMSGDGADEGLDELEEEDREKLERHIRELETENFDLRRGVWRDQRKAMQPNLSMDAEGAHADDFDEVDLNGSGSATRKSSTMHAPPAQSRHSGFTQVLSSGLAAFRTSTTSPDSQAQRLQTRPRNDSLLEEFDDDAFDESAFATAQREEEMRKMVEHVREVKKGLKQWQGWRLDLVDLRRAGGGGMGYGEIFEV